MVSQDIKLRNCHDSEYFKYTLDNCVEQEGQEGL